MKMALTIASRELRSLFLSPLAWSILGVVQFILALLFLRRLEEYISNQADWALSPRAIGGTEYIVPFTYHWTVIIMLLVMPLLTMRLISEEKSSRTLPLLFSAPVSMTEIVLGKYLGILGFLAIMLGLITLMPLSLLAVGTLDFGLLASNLLGLGLLLAAFAAAGLFMSTLCSQPVVAAVTSFGLLLLLWIFYWVGGGNQSVMSYLSLLGHYEPLLSGLFNSSDVLYYLLFILTFLVLSIRRLDADRLQH